MRGRRLDSLLSGFWFFTQANIDVAPLLKGSTKVFALTTYLLSVFLLLLLLLLFYLNVKWRTGGLIIAKLSQYVKWSCVYVEVVKIPFPPPPSPLHLSSLPLSPPSPPSPSSPPLLNRVTADQQPAWEDCRGRLRIVN